MGACAQLSPPTFNTCGNGIVEAGNDEECEPTTDVANCGRIADGESLACKFTCIQRPTEDEAATCPEGYTCGTDLRCRAPAFEYDELPQTFALGPGEAIDLQVHDLDGSGTDELVVTVLVSDDTTPTSVSSSHEVVVLDSTGLRERVSTGGPPAVGLLDEGGPQYVFAAAGLGQLSLDLAFPFYVSGYGTQAFEVGEDLGLKPVLLGGAVRVQGEPGKTRLVALDARSSNVLDDRLVLSLANETLQVVASQGARAAELNARPEAWINLNELLAQLDVPAEVLGVPTSGMPRRVSLGYCAALGWTDASDRSPGLVEICDDEAPSTTPLVPPSLGMTAASALVLEDVDGDGLDDALVIDDAGAVRISYAVGDGSFDAAAVGRPTATGDGAFATIVAGIATPTQIDDGVSLLSVRDRNGDGLPDPITSSTFFPSCTGDCSCGTHECRPSRVPSYDSGPGGLVDVDGDGREELVAIVTEVGEGTWEAAGLPAPSPGSLVVVGNPGTIDWDALPIPLQGEHRLISSGDFNADGKGDVALLRASTQGEILVLGFGSSGRSLELVEVGPLEEVGDVLMAPRALWAVSRGDDVSSDPLVDLTELRGVPGSQEFRIVSGSLGGTPDFDQTGAPVRVLHVGSFVANEPAAAIALGFEQRSGFDQPFPAVTLYERTTQAPYLEGPREAFVTTTAGRDLAFLLYSGARTVVDLDGDGTDELVVFGAYFRVPGAGEGTEPVRGGRVAVFGETGGVIDTLYASALLPPDPLTNVQPSELDEVYGQRPFVPGEQPVGGGLGDTPESADLDKDGNTDLFVLTDSPDPRLAVWPGDGSATLNPDTRQLLSLPAGARGLALERIGDDGAIDFVVVYADSVRRLRVDLSTGELTDGATLVSGGGEDVVLGDFDGDGVRDLAVMVSDPEGGGQPSFEPGAGALASEGRFA